MIDEFFASTWQDIYIQQQELIKIEDAGPAVRQRAERDLQVALDVITSLGLSPINDDLDEVANGELVYPGSAPSSFEIEDPRRAR